MIKSISLIILAFFGVQTMSAQEEVALVRGAFNNYKNAILNNQGERATQYVDSNTISYYDQILEHAKKADSQAINQLNIMDKMMILSIRHRTSTQSILSMNGKQLLIYAIKEGMIGKGSVAKNDIGDIRIEGNKAYGQFITNGKKTPFKFDFNKENNQWKFDLTSLLKIGTPAFKQLQKESGESENEFIFKLLSYVTGKEPDVTIWQPISK